MRCLIIGFPSESLTFGPMAKNFPLQFRNYEENIWKDLLNWRKEDYPTIAGTITSALQDEGRSFEDVGLSPRHAFSILELKEIESTDKKSQYKYVLANALNFFPLVNRVIVTPSDIGLSRFEPAIVPSPNHQVYSE